MEPFIGGLLTGTLVLLALFRRAVRKWAESQYGNSWRETGSYPRLRDAF